MPLNIKSNKKKNDKKCIIFDFDGTIADTFELAIDIINSNPSRYGVDHIDKNEIPRLRSLSMPYLLREFNIHLLEFPILLSRMRKDLKKQIHDLKPYHNILSVIKELYDQGYVLGVLTNNSRGNVISFFKKEEVHHTFHFISSAKGLFGKSKSLEKLMKKYKLNIQNTIYVGDEVRDIEACHKAKISIISVSWGFNSKELLEKFHPTYLVSKPQEILSVINNHFNK